MDSIETAHRLQFAFTITYHYIFPQLTMGLALLIVVLKTIALRTGSVLAHEGVRFWAKIFEKSIVDKIWPHRFVVTQLRNGIFYLFLCYFFVEKVARQIRDIIVGFLLVAEVRDLFGVLNHA